VGHLLTDCEPREVWEHFYRLTQIPRPSGQERGVCRYIYDLAESLGMDVTMDSAGGPDFGNVIVRCPAAPGYESAPITVIQSHVDIVALPEEHRALPLDLILDGMILRARGSTLGADNGIAAAMALTLMAKRDIAHGPLELLFTINEEAGMTGTRALSETALKGRFLINIDAEEEGVLNICSAGACHSVLKMPLVMEPAPEGFAAVRLRVTGGRGGHSGMAINSGRANAGQLLARLLYGELKTFDFRLSEIAWGEVMNAIPSQAGALVLVKAEKVGDVEGIVGKWQSIFKDEFGVWDGRIQVICNVGEPIPERAMIAPATEKVLSFLLALPHGVSAMSNDIPGLVETSSNLALVRTSTGELVATVSQRSLNDPSLDAIVTRCEAVANLAGAQSSHIGKNYGWKPDMTSPLLALCRKAYAGTFGEEPKVAGLHGMIECGFIKEKYPQMDMISIGPTIWDAHAPTSVDFVPGRGSDEVGERVDIAGVARLWEFLKAILKGLATIPLAASIVEGNG
jgi:dipeptidase D